MKAPLTTIDLANPINWGDPRNEGRVMWFLALPGTTGGGDFLDLVGLGNNGHLNGYTASGLGWTDDNPRPGGHASLFGQASPSYSYVSTPYVLPTTNFTVSFWYRPTVLGGSYAQRPFGAADHISGTHGIDFVLNNGGGGVAIVFRNSGAGNDFTAGANPTLGEWEKVHIVCSSSAMAAGGGSYYAAVYRNGVFAGGNASTGTMSTGGLVVNWGTSGGGIPLFGTPSVFDGNLDDMTIWERPFSEIEAAADYDSSLRGYPGVLNDRTEKFAPPGGVAATPSIINVTATTTINAAGTASVFRPATIRVVTASNQVILSGTPTRNAIYGGPHEFDVSATTQIKLSDSGGVGENRIIFADGRTALNLAGAASGGAYAFYSVSASTSFSLTTTLREYLSPINVSASSTFALSQATVTSEIRAIYADAKTSIAINPQADSDGQIRTLSADAKTSLAIHPSSSVQNLRIINVAATTSLNVYGNSHVAGDRLVGATTGINLSASASQRSEVIVSAISGLIISPSAPKRSRDINVSAATSMGLETDNGSNQFRHPGATATISITGSAWASIGWHDATSRLVIGDTATASVELPGGGSVPGGDANSGLRAVAYPNVSGTFPFSFAETPSGLLLLANGVDPMLRWNGLSGMADTAGVTPPATAISMGGQDVGTLVGMRYSYCRFVDRNGNYSAPSPISNGVNLGRDAAIEDIAVNVASGVVTVRSGGHGLATGEPVIFGGIGGLPIDGGHYVTVIDEDHFFLTDLRITSGTWTGGGYWIWGVNAVVYQSVPVPAEGKVVRRQILRNLDGSADVFYVDIDTTDLISATLTSTRGDEDLSSCESVPLTTDNELPYASRYAVPPSHKSIIASHMGRIFACGEVACINGNVSTRHGSKTVQGIGTDWPATLAGRFLYVPGAKQSYEIASVDVAAQKLTLTASYADGSTPYSLYAIRPAPGERRLVYYSEPGLPEAWPPWNSFAIPEEDDEIVGMFARTGFLYFVEKRHIHRFTMQDEPSEGENFASINRGCINGRCFVQVENVCYLLDEAGIHAFDGGQGTEPISNPIQTIFQSDGLLGGLIVDWSADPTLWHASHDPVRNTIRWFVQMEGYDAIHHAICYEYRQQRWWIEQYPTPITSSTTGVVGYRRALCGSDARRVIVLGEGALDLVADAATGIGGTVTDADSTSLTDANASFPANLAGAPVSITYGASGRRQQRIVAENTSTRLIVVEPWDVIPDPTCRYQVGGVQWSWRSGWFEHITEEEDSNPRDVMLTYQPTVNESSVDIQLFYDHSSDPKSWSYDVDQDGVSILNGDPNITVNLMSRSCRAGWSLQRLGGHSEVYGYGEQFVQILLAGVQCGESIRIFQITMNGVRTSEDD